MKILKKGRIPGDIIHIGKCTNCGTEVEFKRSEGEFIHDPRDGDHVKVACPVCQQPIYSHIRSGNRSGDPS